jgi:hypothetical protein
MTQTPFAEWQSTHPRVAESLPHRLPDDGSCGTAHFTTAGAALAPAAPGISIAKLNALAPHGGRAVGAVSPRDLQKRQTGSNAVGSSVYFFRPGWRFLNAIVSAARLCLPGRRDPY